MESQFTYLTTQLFNNISLEILSDLFHSKKSLTINELNKKYSYRQYQYMLKKLESYLVVKSYKVGKKKYYKLNQFYNELVRSVLEIKEYQEINNQEKFPQSLSYDKRFFRVISALKGIKGWAFTDTTALLLWVPFLDLQLPYFTICVRDRYLKKKLEENFSRSVLRVQLQTKYFSQKSNIVVIKGVPVLKPELLVLRVLRDENSRVRLSALFLFSFLSSKKILRYQKSNLDLFPSIVYFLLALKKLLNEDTELSAFLKQWFLNLDHYNADLFLSYYLQQMGKRRKIKEKTFGRFELLRIKQQQQSNQWTDWDRLGMLFPEKVVKFEPSEISELIIKSPSYLLAEA
jgi:hypothetical protein